jgi:hypothetical protein
MRATIYENAYDVPSLCSPKIKHHFVDICDERSNRANLFGVISSLLAVHCILIPLLRTSSIVPCSSNLSLRRRTVSRDGPFHIHDYTYHTSPLHFRISGVYNFTALLEKTLHVPWCYCVVYFITLLCPLLCKGGFYVDWWMMNLQRFGRKRP